jgi:hypothetical protein
MPTLFVSVARSSVGICSVSLQGLYNTIYNNDIGNNALQILCSNILFTRKR